MQNVDKRIDGHKAKLHRVAHYTPEQIEHLQGKADGQEKDIARWFFNHPSGESPTWLHKEMDLDCPITSVRRSITNLTDAGILVKTDQVKTSIYGRPETIWRWRTPDDQPVASPQSELFESKPQSNGAFSQ